MKTQGSQLLPLGIVWEDWYLDNCIFGDTDLKKWFWLLLLTRGSVESFCYSRPLHIFAKWRYSSKSCQEANFLKVLENVPKRRYAFGEATIWLSLPICRPYKDGARNSHPRMRSWFISHKKEKIAHSAIPVLVERRSIKLSLFLYILPSYPHVYTSVYKSFIFQHLCKFFPHVL